jgi:V8-like Glu-specific endopeptidase
MKKRLFSILLFLLFLYGPAFHLSGQLSQGGKPVEIKASIMQTVPVIDIPSLSSEQSIVNPGIVESSKLKHLYFANNYIIKADPQSSGKWINDQDGNKIWLLGIRSDESYSIGLILSKFQLKGEARLFVFNETRSCVVGAFTRLNNNTSDILPVTHIPGKCIYIQLEIPDKQMDYGELIVGEAALAYLPLFAEDPDRFGASDTCNIDINCKEGAEWQDLKRSVCRIIINVHKCCTGILINAANSSKIPYILTTAHCIGSQGEANKSIFYFNYESPICNGPDGFTTHQISGSTLISTGDSLGDYLSRDSLDFSLVKLNVQPPDSFRVYYAGWNRTELPANETVTIHHPYGDVKKISCDFDSPETGSFEENGKYPYILNSHWKILQWDIATTEPGSSGCPLFDQDKRLVGLLTGGEANCVSSVNDYFTKFDYSWNYYDQTYKKLQTWLDPLNSGVYTIDGLDYNASVSPLQTEALNVFPNPGTGDYSIQLEWVPAKNGKYSIFNATGEIIQSGNIKKDNIFRFALPEFPAGIYFIRLMFPDRIYTARIVHLPD